MQTSTKNLMMLLGMAPMGFGACTSDGDDNGLTTFLTAATSPFDSGDPDESGGDPGDGDPGDGDPGDGDGDTTGDGDGDTTGDGDGDTTGDGDGDGDGDTTGDGDGDGDPFEEVCATYAEFMEMCYGPTEGANALMYCTLNFDLYEDFVLCADAFEAYYVCLSQLTCDELATGTYCDEENDAIVTYCI